MHIKLCREQRADLLDFNREAQARAGVRRVLRKVDEHVARCLEHELRDDALPIEHEHGSAAFDAVLLAAARVK